MPMGTGGLLSPKTLQPRRSGVGARLASSGRRTRNGTSRLSRAAGEKTVGKQSRRAYAETAPPTKLGGGGQRAPLSATVSAAKRRRVD